MNWLKKLRKEKGYKQSDMAELCGISQSHYGHIETCVRKPSIELAKKIGKVLECDWTSLFDIVPDMGILSNKYSKLVVLDTKTNTPLAIITDEIAETASDDIVIKLTPN